jgi:hypothetical protein
MRKPGFRLSQDRPMAVVSGFYNKIPNIQAHIMLQAKTNYNAELLFAGTYKVVPRDGPFQYFGDTVKTVLPPNSKAQVDFKVDPYYRIAASVVDSTFTYTITAPASNTAKMQEIIFLVGKSPILDESVSSNTTGMYINLWKKSVSGVADNTILGISGIYTIGWVTTHLPKGEYYFRVGARTSVARYNYSPVIKATVH